MRPRSFLPVKARFLTALTLSLGALAVVPAASQALAVATIGISSAGTVTGQWASGPFTGSPQTVQYATVANCFNVPSAFVAHWTDPLGTHTFRMDPAAFESNCVNPGPNGPDAVRFAGPGMWDSPIDNGSLTFGDLESARSASNPFTVGFNLNTPEGLFEVSAATPGPLQGAPGRITPFGPPFAA